MRRLRRVVILAMLTIAGTFTPPYPSNANFPPQPPTQQQSGDTTADQSGDTGTTATYDFDNR